MDDFTRRMIMGAAGGASTKTYVDDVFSTYVYTGNQTAGHTITNGIDLAGEGGLVWIKGRESAYQHELVDTVRGAGYLLKSDGTSGQGSSTSSELDQFNSDGFRLAYRSAGGNTLDQDYVSWSFRESKGFFDVVTWTGNDTAGRQISHYLSSIPGCILVKCTSSTSDWMVYHRGIGAGNRLKLNSSTSSAGSNAWNQETPTSTYFELGSSEVNAPGETYVAYVFAGGESTAATARSVDYDGSGDYLTQTCDAVLRNWWDQAFTVEYWVNADGFVSSGNGGPGVLGVCAPTSNGETWSFGPQSNGTVEFYYWNGSIQQITTTKALNLGQWYHLAMVYDGSSSIKIYIDGTLEKSATKAGSPTGSSTVFSIGKIANGSEFNGRVSNVRITHQALYTSSFKPSTEPFTTTSQGATGSNVKLLCCNNSSVTGSTVTPASITANGNPTASTDSPFDDPEGFKFGEGGDQNIIKNGIFKCDSSGQATVYLGWEPQWLMWKKSNSSGDWGIYDSMRGVITGEGDQLLRANTSASEVTTGVNVLDFTPTGFKVNLTAHGNGEFIFTCLRRTDGYVEKPAEAGTDAFNVVLGAGNYIIPEFAANFAVDMGIVRQFANVQNFYVASRLTGTKYLQTNNTASEASAATFVFDSNAGWNSNSNNTNISWMWKRGAGFDVVTYTGNGVIDHQIPHSMNNIPEMMWVRDRNATNDGTWFVWHKGLNNGNPGTYFMRLNTAQNEGEYDLFYGDPTSTHFSLYSYDGINGNNVSHLAYLFASVNGISKVGRYTGTDADINLSFGFTPRLFIVKMADGSGAWHIFDTVRGITGSGAPRLELSSDSAQNTSAPYVEPYTNGIKIVESGAALTDNGKNYIYYAHA